MEIIIHKIYFRDVSSNKDLTKILPAYLSGDVEYLSSGYFCGFIREYADRLFEENGLIKPNNTDKRFYVKAYAWTFEK